LTQNLFAGFDFCLSCDRVMIFIICDRSIDKSQTQPLF